VGLLVLLRPVLPFLGLGSTYFGIPPSLSQTDRSFAVTPKHRSTPQGHIYRKTASSWKQKSRLQDGTESQ